MTADVGARIMEWTADMAKSGKQLDREIAGALGRSKASRRPKVNKSTHEILKNRLDVLRSIMADALGDDGWKQADPWEIEKWISVGDELSDREWTNEAKDQLINQSVLPEHAGAPPPNVRAWNDAFISTYRMNLDSGMTNENAIDSARQNANDTIDLKPGERELTNTNPELYQRRRR